MTLFKGNFKSAINNSIMENATKNATKILLKKEGENMISTVVQLIGYSLLGGLGGLILGLAIIGALTVYNER